MRYNDSYEMRLERGKQRLGQAGCVCVFVLESFALSYMYIVHLCICVGRLVLYL